jgi:hypothetical protein
VARASFSPRPPQRSRRPSRGAGASASSGKAVKHTNSGSNDGRRGGGQKCGTRRRDVVAAKAGELRDDDIGGGLDATHWRRDEVASGALLVVNEPEEEAEEAASDEKKSNVGGASAMTRKLDERTIASVERFMLSAPLSSPKPRNTSLMTRKKSALTFFGFFRFRFSIFFVFFFLFLQCWLRPLRLAFRLPSRRPPRRAAQPVLAHLKKNALNVPAINDKRQHKQQRWCARRRVCVCAVADGGCEQRGAIGQCQRAAE